MEKPYPYRLGRRVYRCPACNRKTFKRYETADGTELGDACGRCNREVKCRYHLPPRAFFQGGGNRPALSATGRSPLPALPPPPSFIADALVQSTVRERHYALNPLFRYLCSRFRSETVRDVFRQYGVGFAVKWGGSAVFWQRDQYGLVRSGKIMAYDADTGHRIKHGGAGLVSWVHRELHLPHFVLEQCFFGAHIAAAKPRAKVLMVESEKTALVVACHLAQQGRGDDYAVLACGGAGNIFFRHDMQAQRYYRFRVLAFRHVVLVPDADMYDRWLAAAADMRALAARIQVFDIRPLTSLPQADAADIICP